MRMRVQWPWKIPRSPPGRRPQALWCRNMSGTPGSRAKMSRHPMIAVKCEGLRYQTGEGFGSCRLNTGKFQRGWGAGSPISLDELSWLRDYPIECLMKFWWHRMVYSQLYPNDYPIKVPIHPYKTMISRLYPHYYLSLMAPEATCLDYHCVTKIAGDINILFMVEASNKPFHWGANGAHMIVYDCSSYIYKRGSSFL